MALPFRVPALKEHKKSLRILMIAAELAPWAKVGGLGDVISALPTALERAGAEVVVALPAYPQFQGIFEEVVPLHQRPFSMSWGALGSYDVYLRLARHPSGFQILLVDCPVLFARAGIYYAPGEKHEYRDSLIRWAALCRGALFGASLLGGQWDIVHAHDMHGALALPLLRQEHAASPLCHARTVLSIHNLVFQGQYPLSVVEELGLDPALSAPFGAFEFYGRFNCMKAGLEFADGIHTVSPTYAVEITEREDFGHGLRGLLWCHRSKLTGILNGIDLEVWDPSRDPHCSAHYSVDDLSGKEHCKEHLQRLCGWEPDPEQMIIGVVSRLSHQKGLDLLCEILPRLQGKKIQIVVLGQGDAELEELLQKMAEESPSSVYVNIGFDEVFSHQIQAGADTFLMPSRFEPCGLAQMYAMCYGTLPIVRRTGGLKDTVEPIDLEAQSGVGFCFDDATSEDLLKAVLDAYKLWGQEELWEVFMKKAMRKDFSWEPIAQKYLHWYNQLCEL